MTYVVNIIPSMKKKLLEDVFRKSYDAKEDIEKLEQLTVKEFDSLKETIEQVPEWIILSTPLANSLKKTFKDGYFEGFGSADIETLKDHLRIGEIDSLVLYMGGWRIGSIEKK